MAKKLKVILLEDVAGYGRSGDIIQVSEGYARNALFPDGKAALATNQLQTQHQQQQQKKQQQAEQQLREMQELAASFDNTELELIAKVNEGDELYGSLTSKDIAAKLAKEGKIAIKAKDIKLSESPIKSTGTYKATVTLSPDVDFTLNVIVSPEPDTQDDAS